MIAINALVYCRVIRIYALEPVRYVVATVVTVVCRESHPNDYGTGEIAQDNEIPIPYYSSSSCAGKLPTPYISTTAAHVTPLGMTMETAVRILDRNALRSTASFSKTMAPARLSTLTSETPDIHLIALILCLYRGVSQVGIHAKQLNLSTSIRRSGFRYRDQGILFQYHMCSMQRSSDESA